MAAVLTSVANGVEVTESSLGGLQYIGSQSDVSVNGSNTGIIVRTPSGSIYQFTNADMDELTAVEAAQTLVAALNAGGSTPVAAYTEISFTWYQAGTADPVIVSKNSSPSITIAAIYEEPGLLNFAFPTGTFTDTTVQKVELLATEFVNAPGLRSIAYLLGGDQMVVYIYDPSDGYAAINGAGDLGGERYITTVIRVFPTA